MYLNAFMATHRLIARVPKHLFLFRRACIFTVYLKCERRALGFISEKRHPRGLLSGPPLNRNARAIHRVAPNKCVCFCGNKCGHLRIVIEKIVCANARPWRTSVCNRLQRHLSFAPDGEEGVDETLGASPSKCIAQSINSNASHKTTRNTRVEMANRQ